MSVRALELSEFPAFQGLSSRAMAELSDGAAICTYKLGQLLCERKTIPNQILLIRKGEARLLGRDQGQLRTFEKLGSGCFVGLASFLRAAPCEEVSAASELEVISISDALILKLLSQEESFRRWCSTNLFAAELIELLSLMLSEHPKAGVSLQSLLARMRPQARLFCVGQEQPAELAEDELLIVASQNIKTHPIGTPLRAQDELPNATPPLPARLIVLPDPQLVAPHKPVDHSTLIAANLPANPNTLIVANAPANPNKVEDPSLEKQPEPSQPVFVSGETPLASGLDLGQSDRNEIQLLRAKGSVEEVLACFQMLSKELNLPFRRDAIEKILRKALHSKKRLDLQLCGDIASMMGLHVSGTHVPATLGNRLETPALLSWNDSFAVVARSNANGLVLASPREGWVDLNAEAMGQAFPNGIEMLVLERKNTSPQQRFGFAWFWPVLRRHRNVLIQVLLASFVVQLFTLANPLLIQVIIDKVINQRSLETLQVLGIALVVVTLMEGIIGGLRTFLFSEVTNRIDMRLASEVADHLLRLPLNYFEKRPVGELGTRIAELEKIRSFITGQSLSTLLDTFFSIIYIMVMFIYSWLLTLLALSVLPIQVGITLMGAPLFRRQYREATRENAKAQSYMNELLTGIQTVKSQNVEMIGRSKWQGLYGKYISRSFKNNVTGTVLSQISKVLQKLSQLLVLWVGATLVLKGQMSLGQLIAFRIISGYVTQPLLRLSSTWQKIQEIKVSFDRIADVVDTPEESDQADRQKIPMPDIVGDVKFEGINFAFSSSTREVLSNINMHIPAGTFVAVVGQSGSGKSTFTKMITRLYTPNSGRVLIDDYDIDKVELYSLRRQIGIVPQDPLLFAGTVSENVALADGDASNEAIVKACRLACANDFIMKLPTGYSSQVGERGSSLSGGQRQRLALARTLLEQPKLLILDEATSALDYDTERRVFKNLIDHFKGTTMFIVTHRLSTVHGADLIIMLDDGVVVETGSHAQLIEKRGRYYALNSQQEAGL